MTGRARVRARGQSLSLEVGTVGISGSPSGSPRGNNYEHDVHVKNSHPGNGYPSNSGHDNGYANGNGRGNGHGEGYSNGNGRGNGYSNGNGRARPQKTSLRSGLSAGDGRRSFAERGGKMGRNLHDLGINTRETMSHVKDSKTGTSGIPLRLVTNLFGLGLPSQWHLYQYHVAFSPELESRRLKTALLYSHSDLLGKAKAFDGAILFLSQKLEKQVTELSTVTKSGESINITITLTNQLPSGSPVCIQFFNIIFKKVLKMLAMYQVGRNYYSPKDPVEIPQHKLTLWPGFAVSIMQFENKLMLSADVSHKVLRNETVLEFMENLYSKMNAERFMEACEKELLGLVVLTRYNNKTYRIDDIDWTVNPTKTFKKSDGTEISYVDYYKNQYEVVVKDLNQPMLVSQLKAGKNDAPNITPRVVHLLPELCFLTGLSSRALSDFRLMKDLSMETQLNPDRRQQRLLRLADNIERNRDARLELENWGMRLEPQLNLTGRVVPPEKIMLQDHICQPMSAADWSKETRGSRVIGVQPLERWLMVFGNRNGDIAEKFLNCMKRAGSGMGFNIEYPKIVQVEDHPTGFLRAMQQHVNPDLQLVFCILPSNQKDCYDAIKKYLSLDSPVPSQCVVSRTLNKQQMMMSVATKVVMQMMVKIGGELWAVEIPLKSLMVVGIDVNKDALNKGNSVVGFVSSTNPKLTRWFSRCIIQGSNTDIADCLKVCMKGAIERWQKCNNDLPGRIVVYRDGVGDGQLRMVVDYEVPQLLNSFQETSIEYSPKLSVVVVRKRCIPRFFAESNRELQNPPLGTIVDREATRPEWYDFYLVSQVARQGTVNPTYYNVVYDDNGLKPDHMQRLTYKMCHLYYNWPGVIRVPAPCQYAYKLTFLVGQSIHKEPSLDLSDTLFYL